MRLARETALIEAILFLENEPLDVATLGRISSLSQDIVLEAVSDLQNRYQNEESGLEIIEIAGGFLIVPRNDLWESLKDRYGRKNENILSKAAIETLSIIAYSQPITRSEIAGIRGVSPDGMIKLLLAKDLIRPVGKKDSPGRPVQYGTTTDFLKAFRLASIADLPRLDDLSQERFELEE